MYGGYNTMQWSCTSSFCVELFFKSSLFRVLKLRTGYSTLNCFFFFKTRRHISSELFWIAYEIRIMTCILCPELSFACYALVAISYEVQFYAFACSRAHTGNSNAVYHFSIFCILSYILKVQCLEKYQKWPRVWSLYDITMSKYFYIHIYKQNETGYILHM